MRPTSTSLLGLLSAPTGYRQGRCDANQRSGVVSPRWICVSRGRSDMHAFLSFYVTSRSTIIVNCSSCRTVPLALNPVFQRDGDGDDAHERGAPESPGHHPPLASAPPIIIASASRLPRPRAPAAAQKASGALPAPAAQHLAASLH